MNRIRECLSLYSGFFVFILAVIGAIVAPLCWFHEYKALFAAVAYVTFFALYLGSIAIIITRVSRFDRHTESIRLLLILYFECIALFAGIYLWLYLLGQESQISGLYDMSWEMLEDRSHFDFSVYWKQVVLLTFDTIHFSIVTGSTLGYGDMLPKHTISKLVVDVQVLVTIGIVILGYGRANSNHRGERHRPE